MAPGLGLHDDVLAAVLDVDGREVGVGRGRGCPATAFLPWDLQVRGVGLIAVAGADDDVEARVSRCLPRLLDDAGQAEHAAGEVLVVVAVDVVGVHGGGRGVVERHAGDRADLPALLLELVEEGRDQPAVVGDVDAVVVRLDPADELGGAVRRVGVGVEDPADGLRRPPGRPRWPTGP